ncbi:MULTISPECIES: class I SAM-dependent methyltransferase [Tatumella]|uniref:Class I SAM-dependent methyltransferase n=1 Tax=Tatumella punctata TaxID=399969 RepID=A0ABW1VLW5_9GAMM|nr:MULTISPECIES: class I SAM-dependent methyltransferase [unclassified Tatumella]MBS0856661.1 class I SAM-dependent methyltransferase [Tatumella sp. JGM16]MBS0877628.1 class I SAM-dependent methyltransferase [Tatumella sp. JGM82]MBS0891333.1 class I SAM-dependent methyltransferase [Tatumella sp. JGM94]MBS0902160.1 class I SAM-dependent methyltransferase [Tatumella sp. JGM100]MBS0912875.1 class I SAM-dependent methyltransferase [Tatumella sp. JGM91]
MDSQPGIRVYNSVSLRLYNWWVMSVANRFAWRCSTPEIQLPFYRRHLSSRHLDIGTGTGYYPRHCMNISQLTLLDLNPECLKQAERRIGPARVTATVQHDIFLPLPEKLQHKFNSVALYYVLHCLNGSADDKFTALKNVTRALSADGILFGTTISGERQRHNLFGRLLMNIMNRKGIFTNYQDSASVLEGQLRQLFRDVTLTETGAVIMFTARFPYPVPRITDH